nr:hypothetical protein [Tanacetum cinerariifolium]
MKKIIKGQVKSQVKEQVSRILPRTEESVNATLAAEVLTRSSHSSRTSYAVAADPTEMELKKILIKKMEGNKSTTGTQSRQLSVSLLLQRNLYRLPVRWRNPHIWCLKQISALAKKIDARSSFNELLDTPIDFSNFIMNRLGVDTLTPELLAGPTYELMRGSCNSLTELEYHLEEVYKATTDQLDWVNPEGQQYPHNPLQPPPLISNNRGRHVIPFEHFINNDLEYLRRGASSRKYTTSVTKTKAADYGHIKWIEDLEYYACATGEAVPKPKASARKKKGGSGLSTPPPTPIATPTPTTTVVAAPRLSAAAKGKQPARAKTPTEPTNVERTEAEKLKIVLKRSRQETYISQQRGSGTDEGTGSRPGVLDVPSDDSEEELSWNSSDDEDVDEQTKGREDSEGDKTDERSEDEGNDEEDQDLRLSEEARIQEEEEADELYRDVDINQGRGLQVSQDIDDSHVTLTPVNPDGLQESSSVSSFVTSMLNPINDTGVESIFITASSPIVSLQTPTPIMTPSTIATITTSTDAPIPPTIIPSIILKNLPTFDSVFRFDERLKSLETTFSEYRQTNPFADVMSAIPGIVHQYMTQQMTEAVREAVQIQTDRLQDSFQRENDEFLRNIDENMKQIIKGQVKSQVKEQVSRILPRIEESVELKKILIEKMEGNKSIQRSDEQRNLYKALEGPFAGSDRGSKRQREGGEHASASTPSETATGSAGRSTTGSQSRQLSASESAFLEEPVQTTCQMEEPSHPVFEIGAEDQPSVQTSQHPEWRIIAVTELKIVEWHNYKHLDWISVRRDDDKIYKFKEGDLKRLHIQDIEDIMLLLVQVKMSNLTVEERFAFNVSLRMFTRSIVIQRRVEDL